jgi:hypothetical protein
METSGSSQSRSQDRPVTFRIRRRGIGGSGAKRSSPITELLLKVHHDHTWQSSTVLIFLLA